MRLLEPINWTMARNVTFFNIKLFWEFKLRWMKNCLGYKFAKFYKNQMRRTENSRAAVEGDLKEQGWNMLL
jgi:hypothetical protein